MKNPKHTRTAILTVYPTGRISWAIRFHGADGRMQRTVAQSFSDEDWPRLFARVFSWRDECRIIVRAA